MYENWSPSSRLYKDAYDDIKMILPWWRFLSYRNQSIDLQSKSMDWFLYDGALRHERVQDIFKITSAFEKTCVTINFEP